MTRLHRLALIALAPCIIIRHDRPDARYLELGARYPAVVRVGARGGDGTLVDTRWVLTAAHVADGVSRRPGGGVVIIGTREIPIRQTFIHPRWREMSPDDVALVELAEPVTDVAPSPLYRWRDEAGRTAVLIGHGRTGTGADRVRRDDDQRRGATNRVEEASETFLSTLPP